LIYRVSKREALKFGLTMGVHDKAWCTNPEAISLNWFNILVLKDTNKHLKMVDLGACSNPLELDHSGHSCILQAIFWNMFDGYYDDAKYGWSLDTLMSKFTTTFNVDMRELANKIDIHHGVSITNIAKLLRECIHDSTRLAATIKIWTLESTSAYAACGASVSQGASVNIAVQAGHAYGLITASTIKHLKRIRNECNLYSPCVV